MGLIKIKWGPIFGGSEGNSDLVIADNSDTNKNSCSYFGHYYINPDYVYKSKKAYLFLAGSCQFQVADIEVYAANLIRDWDLFELRLLK